MDRLTPVTTLFYSLPLGIGSENYHIYEDHQILNYFKYNGVGFVYDLSSFILLETISKLLIYCVI